MLQRELLRRAVTARVATSQEPIVLQLAQWCVHGTPSATATATPCAACVASVTERPPRAVWGTRVALWPGCVQWGIGGGGGGATTEPTGPAECFVDLSHQAEGTGSGSDGWDTLASLRQALSGLTTLVSLQGLVNVAGLDLWFWDADSKRLVTRPPWQLPSPPPPSQPSLPLGRLPAARAGRGPRRAACVVAMHTVTPAGAAAHSASPWRRAWVAVCLGGDVPGMSAMVSRGP